MANLNKSATFPGCWHSSAKLDKVPELCVHSEVKPPHSILYYARVRVDVVRVFLKDRLCPGHRHAAQRVWPLCVRLEAQWFNRIVPAPDSEGEKLQRQQDLMGVWRCRLSELAFTQLTPAAYIYSIYSLWPRAGVIMHIWQTGLGLAACPRGQGY